MTKTKLTRTSCLDADEFGEADVSIQRFKPDFHSLGDDVQERERMERLTNPTGCVFLNPIATIRAKSPTEAFFKIVKKYQAQWCRRFSSTMPRKCRRKAKNWVSDTWIKNRDERYYDRCLCFTGVMLINGRFVPHNQWPTSASAKANAIT